MSQRRRTSRPIALLLLLVGACGPRVRGESYDIVIEGARVVDGTGNPWFYADVAVSGARIARVAPAGALREANAGERIDAGGLVVAPGFIDLQSHSTAALLRGDGRVVSKVTQGVTTEILGEGWTYGPANERTLEARPPGDPAAGRLARAFFGEHGFDAWLDSTAANGVSVNVGSFVGHTTLRVYAMGLADGAADQAQLDTMRAAARRAMEDGAFGVASALIYPPATFVPTEEIIEVVAATAPYGGLYVTHMRSEGPQLLEGLDEAIRIGREAGVSVEIYHLKAAGETNWWKIDAAIAKIDSARNAGLSIEANMYPYEAAGTGLETRIPSWAFADGHLRDTLRDPTARARIKAEMPEFAAVGPEGMLVLALNRPENARFSGMHVSDIAATLDKDWREVILDLVTSERDRIPTIFFLMSNENVVEQLQLPWIKFATDAGGVDPDSTTELLHPRAYGTYPRILGRYVREQEILSLEEAVRKMTSAVAQRLRLRDRGVVREGAYADLAVFDPASIIDRSTYAEPNQLSVGIQQVLVNGVHVVRDGRHTGATPGRVLRGSGYQAR